MKKLLIALAAMMATSAYADCYSEGVRVGDLQKFSKKGMFVKSWEGELVMEGTKISADKNRLKGGNVWQFSVTDPEVAKVIDEATMSGRPVALKYCQGYVSLTEGTTYVVTKAVIR